MTARGDATRARLLAATREVVREEGYAHASTRAIAAAAGVAEGTIYRHYPDKAALFFAALFDANRVVIDDLSGLPERAGTMTVETNVLHALTQLATLREDVLPLELAISQDPELASRRDEVMRGMVDPVVAGPPTALAAYLAAEQRLGRVRPDLDAWQLSVVLLAALFGLGVSPTRRPGELEERLEVLVTAFVRGIGHPWPA